jgi:hypothetical protein
MNKENESLRLWLEEVDAGSAKPLDTKYDLVWKLTQRYGGSPSHNDLLVPLIGKLATSVGAAPAWQDSEQNLWRKIADSVSAFPAYNDTTPELLDKILDMRNITTIYVTDPIYGAAGDYNGTQNTAGTGTDDRSAIQAALDAAYTPGSGGHSDLTHSVSKLVKAPNGKYYISARPDGLPSLSVPPGVTLDLSEAELHFDRPPLTYNSNTAPNPLFCGILLGPLAHIILGKVIMKPDQDQTYGGTWYGMNIDAIRVQESDTSYIIGAGKDNLIIGWRGAGVRHIGCLNSFVSNIKFWANCFGIVQSYFGTAYDGSVTGSGYTRYRGNTIPEGVSVALYVSHCTFLNLYKKGVLVGVDGDYHTPAGGGFEVVTTSKIAGGPVSLNQCSFENIGEEVAYVQSDGGFFMSDIRIERSGWLGNGSGTIFAANVASVKLDKVTWQQQGGTCYLASYTAPLALVTPNPGVFLRCNATDVSPTLQNVFIFNNANLGCQLVEGDNNITRLPTTFNYRTASSNQMQGTNANYMQGLIIENDGGRIWSVSTVGLRPVEAVNGSRTAFTFLNGFTRQKPQRIRADGLVLDATNSDGTTNWTWDTGTKTVTMSVAPTKDLRAYF